MMKMNQSLHDYLTMAITNLQSQGEKEKNAALYYKLIVGLAHVDTFDLEGMPDDELIGELKRRLRSKQNAA